MTLAQATVVVPDSVERQRQQLGGLVSKNEAANLSAPEPAKTLLELRAGDFYTGIVRIVRNGPAKSFEHQGRPGQIARALISDGSRALSLVAWGTQATVLAGFERGTALRIEQGYAKARDEVLELHANDRARLVTPRSTDAIPGLEAFTSSYVRRTLGELREGQEALVRARLAEVYSLKTIVKCSGCGQRLELGTTTCTACGGTQIKTTDVLAARLDDGTAGYRLACFGKLAREVAHAPPSGSLDALETDVRARLFNQEITLLVRPRPSALAGGFELVGVALVQGPT